MPKAPRAPSANNVWVTSTLETLYQKSKRGGKLPTPSYLSPEALLAEALLDELEPEDDIEDTDDTESAEPLEDIEFRRQQTLKKLQEQTRGFLPDVNKVLENLRNHPEGHFSDFEKQKMSAAFRRFKDANGPEIDKDNLPMVLTILGYRVDKEKSLEIADKITQQSALEKIEFESWMEEYKLSEQERYREIFSSFDVDDSGYLDVDETVQFVHSLGIIPLRAMVQEAMSLVDVDGNGSLDYEETVLLMHVLKHSEGFTMAEVNDLVNIFQGFDPNSEKSHTFRVHPSLVSDIMVTFFGPSVIHVARQLQEEVRGSDDAEAGVNFQEALMWTRRVRDVIFQAYQFQFNRFDVDGSNSIDLDELRHLLSVVGHTLTRKALHELLARAQKEGVCQMPADEDINMDFDTFINLMQCLSQTDGFTEDELQEIGDAFKKFDDDGSGDIDVVELSDLLRYMGYRPKMDDVRRLCAQVDTSGDGHLDSREFIAFMRFRRESELSVVLAVFNEFKNSEERIPQAKLETVLRRISGMAEGENETDDSESANAPDNIEVRDFLVLEDVDFDELVGICRKIRDARAVKLRRFAGYKDEEVAMYQEIFDTFDAQKAGFLTAVQFSQVLLHLGYETQTAEQQREMKEQIAQARRMAAEDGIAGAGEPGLNFWIMLKVLRLVARKKTLQDERNLEKVIQESNFSTKEITEFQDVFDSCWTNNLEYEDEDVSQAATKTIPVVAIMRLLRSMGLNLETRDRTELNEQFSEAAGGAPRADFLAFLRLMHWILTRNFCGINDYAASQS